MLPEMENGSSIKYGDLYWLVILADGDEIELSADDMTFNTDGSLVFYGHSAKDNSVRFVVAGFAARQWRSVFAISVFDGHPVAVGGVVKPEGGHKPH